MRRKTIYTEDIRQFSLARMEGGHNISALARELDVPRRLLYQWQMRLEGLAAPIKALSGA
jgi:transposase-like protein